jgi:hypothetical protein
MRTWRSAVAVLALSAVVGAAAQNGDGPPAEQPKLVVWIVYATPVPQYPTILAPPKPLPTTVQEQTAGSFGQAASEVGHTSSNYGQTPSTVGKNAGDAGQTSSTFGQTASTLGTSASNHGQNSSTYGQTAGSFGESLSTIADAGTKAQGQASQDFHHPAHDSQWDGWISAARAAFSGVQVNVLDVREDELQVGLDRTRGTADAPDVLVGSPLPPVWTRPNTGLALTYGVRWLGPHGAVRQTENAPGGHWMPQGALLAAAPHPTDARAFMSWLQSGIAPAVAPVKVAKVTSGSPGGIASRALRNLLVGEWVGDADAEMARFNPQLAQLEALGTVESADRLNVQVDVTDVRADSRLAVVSLRGYVAAQTALGQVSAVAVLRMNNDGRWRLLQITPNLEADQAQTSMGYLAPFCGGGRPAHVVGVSLAAPADGDNRGPKPDLWWDNGGGAGLQVLEWQPLTGTGYATSPVPHLFFVPDKDAKARTRVTAPFASGGTYRWRIWSVGNGGVLVLSPWRTVNVIP